jgi:hypothetical protein
MVNGVSEKKTLAAFTTAPKFRRRGHSASGYRCMSFMSHLWEVHLRKCSYETLEFEFVNFFQTNDDRTVHKYLGRPADTVRSSGQTSTMRLNRDTGKMAQFRYFNTRTVTAKKGLMQILGYISFDKEAVTIHHERMSYFSEQACLESAILLPEFSESPESSILDLRVCPLPSVETIPQGERARENRFEKVVSLNVVRGDSVRGVEEEEREVIDSTHTKQVQRMFPAGQLEMPKLTPEEELILYGQPADEKGAGGH